jgi:hypothetical protein
LSSEPSRRTKNRLRNSSVFTKSTQLKVLHFFSQRMDRPSSSSKKTVAIVGTAGRGAVANSMNVSLFSKMIHTAQELIKKELKLSPSEVVLVSGGAAWADHVAIRLFFDGNFGGLTLHYPCEWDCKNTQFHETGTSSWRTNPGRSANRYHGQFTEKIGVSSLLELKHAHAHGAIVQVHDGFHARNAAIAKAEYLIAFTWASSPNTITGGTKHTWNLSSSHTKIHVSLPTFKIERTEPASKRKNKASHTKRKRLKQTKIQLL